jgi:hypothetical protein
MDAFEITYIANRWILQLGETTLEAEGAFREAGSIRCIVSVLVMGQLVYRDRVTLTGARARRGFLRRLNERGVLIEENALMALDQAIRTTPADRPERQQNRGSSMSGVLPEISGTVVTLAEVEATVKTWLRLEDADVLAVIFAQVIGHRLGGESPWLFVIAPPSGVKTELLRMLWNATDVFPISDLTARTFASGLDTPTGEPSLLDQLSTEILVVKDFTTILEIRHDERQAILAQLREIYDGRFDKFWGTGKRLSWTGRLGFLAGVTPVIDKHHAVMGLLGPRFLQFRVRPADRTEAALQAITNAGRETDMRPELATTAASFLASVGTQPPTIDEETMRWVATIADLVTRARSPVIRDGYKFELEYAPEPEVPARLARQLFALLQGLILVRGGTEVTDEDRQRIARVAWDCLPALRAVVLRALVTPQTLVDTSAIAVGVQYSTSTVRRTLEDVQALELVVREKGTKADRWGVRDDWRVPLAALLESLGLPTPPPEEVSELSSYIPTANPSWEEGDL